MSLLRREPVEGYVARVSRSVTATGVSVVGDIVASATDIGGPWWSLRHDSDSYRAARIAAVSDAVTGAGQYAAALGSSLTGFVHLAATGDSRRPKPVRLDQFRCRLLCLREEADPPNL